MCSVCGRKFRHKQQLTSHLKKKVLVKQLTKFPCHLLSTPSALGKGRLCSRRIAPAGAWSVSSPCFSLFVPEVKRDFNRVNYHAPFTCYKCGRRYTWTDSLTRHLREGCGELPRHMCTLCGRKFKRRDYLLRHENNVHKLE
ncbi:uncharacterized protein LOC143181439 [Calliopsis andreniformis]|uniref:uncharacterized protein LOC143181439 n=1 Tax=Calliopsis andreniformis TaxID=337506 RepID=UPI003FCC3200